MDPDNLTPAQVQARVPEMIELAEQIREGRRIHWSWADTLEQIAETLGAPTCQPSN